MWEPYTLAVKEACPNVAIVFDFFQIVAKYNDVILQVRRQEYHKVSKEDARVIKGSRWILLKNLKTLMIKRNHAKANYLIPMNL